MLSKQLSTQGLRETLAGEDSGFGVNVRQHSSQRQPTTHAESSATSTLVPREQMTGSKAAVATLDHLTAMGVELRLIAKSFDEGRRVCGQEERKRQPTELNLRV